MEASHIVMYEGVMNICLGSVV